MSVEPARMLTSIEFAAECKKISQMSKLAETESRLHKFHLEQTKQLKNDRYEKQRFYQAKEEQITQLRLQQSKEIRELERALSQKSKHWQELKNKTLALGEQEKVLRRERSKIRELELTMQRTDCEVDRKLQKAKVIKRIEQINQLSQRKLSFLVFKYDLVFIYRL